MACFLGFRGDSSISLSQAVRDRTGQAAFLRSARAGPSTQVGWRNVKVSSTFSKVVGFGGRYVPVGRCSAADRAGRRDQTPRPYRGAGGPGARWAPFRTDRGGSRDRSPCLPLLQKRGGRMSPSWDSTKAVAPWLERGKCTSEPKIQCLCGFRHLHLCTREKYRASENRFHLYIGTNEKT